MVIGSKETTQVEDQIEHLQLALMDLMHNYYELTSQSWREQGAHTYYYIGWILSKVKVAQMAELSLEIVNYSPEKISLSVTQWQFLISGISSLNREITTL